MASENCLFCKLASVKENIVYETETFYVLVDRFPFSNRHLLVIPKVHHATFLELDDCLINEAFLIVKKLAQKLRLEKYNLIQNNINQQLISHFHVHLIGCNETGGFVFGEKSKFSLNQEEYDMLVKEVKSILSK